MKIVFLIFIFGSKIICGDINLRASAGFGGDNDGILTQMKLSGGYNNIYLGIKGSAAEEFVSVDPPGAEIKPNTKYGYGIQFGYGLIIKENKFLIYTGINKNYHQKYNIQLVRKKQEIIGYPLGFELKKKHIGIDMGYEFGENNIYVMLLLAFEI